MSSATETHDAPHAEPAHDHPSDLKYIKIAAILGALTLIEILTYTFDMKGTSLILVLMPLMIIKFAMVAGYFMHLKFDSKIFTVMFVSGLAFAIAMYVLMLTIFQWW